MLGTHWELDNPAAVDTGPVVDTAVRLDTVALGRVELGPGSPAVVRVGSRRVVGHLHRGTGVLQQVRMGVRFLEVDPAVDTPWWGEGTPCGGCVSLPESNRNNTLGESIRN